jgi:16S rRNA processing protein RimM
VTKHHSFESLIEVGIIGRPHGVRGELKVFMHFQGSCILNDAKALVVDLNGVRSPMEIMGTRSGSGYVIVSLRGVESREQADALKGGRLLVRREQLPDLEADEYYVHDLLGMEVFDGATRLGVVTSSRPQGDIEIATVRGESEELEVPLVSAFLVELDFAGRKIVLQGTEELPRNPVRKARRSADVSAR